MRKTTERERKGEEDMTIKNDNDSKCKKKKTISFNRKTTEHCSQNQDGILRKRWGLKNLTEV